jgi:hypothetical protein
MKPKEFVSLLERRFVYTDRLSKKKLQLCAGYSADQLVDYCALHGFEAEIVKQNKDKGVVVKIHRIKS